jgi:hypothetical protein
MMLICSRSSITKDSIEHYEIHVRNPIYTKIGVGNNMALQLRSVRERLCIVCSVSSTHIHIYTRWVISSGNSRGIVEVDLLSILGYIWTIEEFLDTSVAIYILDRLKTYFSVISTNQEHVGNRWAWRLPSPQIFANLGGHTLPFWKEVIGSLLQLREKLLRLGFPVKNRIKLWASMFLAFFAPRLTTLLQNDSDFLLGQPTQRSQEILVHRINPTPLPVSIVLCLEGT